VGKTKQNKTLTREIVQERDSDLTAHNRVKPEPPSCSKHGPCQTWTQIPPNLRQSHQTLILSLSLSLSLSNVTMPVNDNTKQKLAQKITQMFAAQFSAANKHSMATKLPQNSLLVGFPQVLNRTGNERRETDRREAESSVKGERKHSFSDVRVNAVDKNTTWQPFIFSPFSFSTHDCFYAE